MHVVSANVIDRRCVEVIATGPKGGSHEFTVHYDRHDKVAYGFRHKPGNEYLLPPLIPETVRTAAWEAYGAVA